jgi:ABC-type lipoprotein export system ATPase subunit
MNSQEGAIWRKWDLHIHTPFSELNNSFPTDFDEYAKLVFNKAIENNIAAIGVTDYFCIKGYKRLVKLVKDEEKLSLLLGEDKAALAKRILLLPNIEFRTTTIVRDPEGKDSRVNFHVIFSDELTCDEIEEDFLRELKFTAQSDPDSEDERWPLTIRNLEKLGQQLKDQHAPFKDKSDLFVGMMNAVIDDGSISKILKNKQSIFHNKYLLVLPADEDLSKCSWDGQGHLSRKTMIQKSHLIFSSNGGTRDFGLGKKHASEGEYLDEFKSFKACIHGSDSHDVEDLFLPDKDRFTWVKADPTFNGLKRLLSEPASRVFVGKEPNAIALQRSKKTKYFNSLGIHKIKDSSFSELWFEQAFPFNTGLVAIIGNKGSGKSALSDTLGLLGNSKNEKYFSFLNSSKFKKARENKARHFESELTWLSNEKNTAGLNDSVDLTTVETIKYIPQNYLETICNEVASGKGSEFDKELKSVIFSNVKKEDRYDCESFDDLMEFITDEKHDRINNLKVELHTQNLKVLSLERKTLPEFKKTLEQQLEQKRLELASHIEGKPEVIRKPGDENDESNKQLAAEIEEKRVLLDKVDEQLVEISTQISKHSRRKILSDKVLSKLSNFKNVYDSFIEDDVEFEELGLSITEIVQLKVQPSKVESIKTDSILQVEALNEQLNSETKDSPAFVKKSIADRIEAIRQEMDVHNQQYQVFLENLAKWEAKKNELEGSAEVSETINYFKSQIEKLASIPQELESLRAQRLETSKSIFNAIYELKEVYASLYAPIEKSIRENDFVHDSMHLGFSVSIVQDNFSDKLFNLVNQGRKGSFCGVEDGQKRLNKIISESGYSAWDEVLEFMTTIDHQLRHDVREDLEPRVNLADIMKKGVSEIEIEDLVFGLSYLSPRYALTWGERTLDQLSPGERGALLLVFYLLVDKDDIPLVIDQPEENLDNESVYKILVPCIKQAKEFRQVVIVTHNPNLAVVCDADQVIYAEMDKPGGNRILYTSGAIENPEINKHIVDVLEGTRPAFDVRDAKYRIIERL